MTTNSEINWIPDGVHTVTFRDCSDCGPRATRKPVQADCPTCGGKGTIIESTTFESAVEGKEPTIGVALTNLERVEVEGGEE